MQWTNCAADQLTVDELTVDELTSYHRDMTSKQDLSALVQPFFKLPTYLTESQTNGETKAFILQNILIAS